ncbi:hypothetical protein O181_078206 [Austropuccinia psidii MF-1]|uniref:CN hydrolase domain-containing protein n=1 Tax=Austropuccinia psidii MF-1 TaxID=1389203 RepID=A0A9Q3FJK4_9BASI|nr:hypothetical protein [Austropuccinia psidii MF-1]
MLKLKLQENDSKRLNPKIKISICQFNSYSSISNNNNNKNENNNKDLINLNLKRAQEFIIEASKKGSSLIIFPEYFLTGIINEDNQSDLVLREDESEQIINDFKTLAIQYNIDIITGTMVARESSQFDNEALSASDPQPKYFNSAYYINKSGQIIGKYRKKNLWHSEKYLTPCTLDHQVFDAGGFRLGMLICWDLAWPESFRELMSQNVDVIVIPSFWTLDEPLSPMRKHDPYGLAESCLIDSLAYARALETESCVIFVNCAGRKEEGYLGRSSVTMPLKGHLFKLDDPSERLETVEIDLSVLEDAKKVYKISEEYPSKKNTQKTS